MNSSQLVYHAEGAANIIYTFAPNTNNILVDELSLDASKYVLRLRKDLPYVSSAATTVAGFNRYIKPLFAERHLLKQILVPLSSDLSSELNELLRESEKRTHTSPRDMKRRGVYLPEFDEEGFGILVPKLSASAPHEFLEEFKPKWLLQSPSAPLHSQRCRTCALHDMRSAKGHLHGRGSMNICPLDLLSVDDVARKAQRLRSLLPVARIDEDVLVREFHDMVEPLLRRLQRVQQEYNQVSLSDFESGHPDLPVAMAIRDCSMFVHFSISSRLIREGDPVVVKVRDVKLADLDLKSTAGGKLERWAELERELISGDWYLGRSIDSVPVSTCSLGHR